MSNETPTSDDELEATSGEHSSSLWSEVLGFGLIDSWGPTIYDKVRHTLSQALAFAGAIALCADGLPLPFWLEIMSRLHPRYRILRQASSLVAWVCAVGLFARLRLLQVMLTPSLQEELTALYGAPVDAPRGLTGANYHEVAYNYGVEILRSLAWKSDPRLAIDICQLTTLRKIGDGAIDHEAELRRIDVSARVIERLRVIQERWRDARRGVRRCGARVDLHWVLARIQDESVRAQRRTYPCDDRSTEIGIRAETTQVSRALDSLNILALKNPDNLAKSLREYFAAHSPEQVASLVDVFRLGFPSGYRELDQHVDSLLNGLLTKDARIEAEIPDLVPMLRSLTAILGALAQGGDLKEKNLDRVDERELQSRIAPNLRVRLGPDVQEHVSQGGGVVDIRYRGLVVELKVERHTMSRESICKKYAGQVVAYQAAEARQVGVLFVLDMTPKNRPPGDSRDDIRVVDVPTHGGDDQEKKYPSHVFVFVANGNIRDPSSYSK